MPRASKPKHSRAVLPTNLILGGDSHLRKSWSKIKETVSYDFVTSEHTVFFKKATVLGIGSSALSIWKLVHLKKKSSFLIVGG